MSPRLAPCTGLSRTEVLVLLAALLVLALVALGPVQHYLEQRRIERGLESARTLNTLLAQYATDNDGVYPIGENTRAPGTSEGIALDLLLNNYTPTADIFAVGSTPRYSGAAKDYADLAPQNMSWDFTGGANATTGIKTGEPNWLPVLYTTGETVDYAKAGTQGYNVVPSGNGPFRQGIIAAYKSGEVRFIPAKPSGPEVPLAFFVFGPGDKNTGTYTQIKP